MNPHRFFSPLGSLRRGLAFIAFALSSALPAFAQMPQSITVAPTSTTVYTGQLRSFFVTGAHTSCSWSGASGSGTNNATGSATWDTPGTYSVSVQCPAGGGYAASNTATASVTVSAWNAQPITLAPATATVYVGQSRSFSVTGAHTSCAWTGATGSGTLNTSGAASWSTPGTYTVSVQCPAAPYYSASNTATATVTVVAWEPQPITISPTTATAYTGQPRSFSVTGAKTSCAWTGATGSGILNTSGTATWASPGTYTVSVSCPAAPYFSASNTATATVTVLPWATQTIAISPASTTVYVGQTVNFTASGTGLNYPYNWTGATVAYPGASKSWSTPGTYTVTVQAPEGNYHTASNVSTSTVTVIPYRTPVITMTASAAVVTVGQQVTFQESGTVYADCVWTGATGSGVRPVTTATKSWSTPGTYLVSVKSPAGPYANPSNEPAVLVQVQAAPPAGTSGTSNTGNAGANFLSTVCGWIFDTGARVLDAVGGPIQMATGAEAFMRPLFSFSGAQPWRFGVFYNSVLAANQPSAGSLGYGWTHPFEVSVVTAGANIVVQQNATQHNTFQPVPGVSGTYRSAEQTVQYDLLTANSSGGWTLKHPDQSTLVFDAAGRLTTETDPHGRQLVLVYDTSGRLASVTEPISATSLAFTYNSAGRLATLTDATGATVSFTYNSSSLLTQIVNQRGQTTNFAYDSNRHLLTLTGDDGAVLTTNTYDTQGRAVSQQDGVTGHGLMHLSYQQATLSSNIVTTVTDKNGAVWTYTFTPGYQFLSLQDPLGRTSTRTYDLAGNLASQTNALGQTSSWTYDAAGNVLTSTDEAGQTTAFTYDTANRLLSTTDPLGHQSVRTYDSSGNLLTLTDEAGRTTTWTYNTNGLPLTETAPGGGVNTFSYTNGRLTQLVDANGVTTQWSYDGNGRVLYRQDALGNQTSFTYDAVGNVLSSTDPLGAVTSATFDARNRKLTQTDPLGAVTHFSYDANNNLVTVTDPLGGVSTFAYDSEDHPIAGMDALGNTAGRAYNAAGELTSTTDGTGAVTQFQHDQAGRVTSTLDPLGHGVSVSYDSRGLPTVVTDPLGRSSTFVHDALGRRTSSANPLGQQTVLTYDALGRLTGVQDPGGLTTAQAYSANGARSSFTNGRGHATSVATDAAGRVTSVTTPGGLATAQTYDARGLPLMTTQPSGAATTLAYDAAGRASSLTDAVGVISYGRDAKGQVLTVTENGHTLTRAYDLAGRVVQFTDASGQTLGYGYDTIGRLTSLTYPDGKVVHYTYDAANRLLSVTDWASRVTSYTYDAAGHLTHTARPNGTSQSRAYDAAGQLTALTETGVDGVTAIHDSVIAYDLAGRVGGETLSPRMPVPLTGTVAQTFDVDNRLLTHNGQSATFDANGNLLALPGGAPAGLAYDARNRLTSAGALSYGYDAEGHRTSVTDATGTTSYVINPQASLSQVLVRTTPDGTVTRYVYGLGLAYEESTGTEGSPQTRFYHFDRRGDTVALTDAAGVVTDRVGYGVYGERLFRTGTSTTPFLFNGLYGVQTDANGLYYHRARYYSPTLRRFLNQDTVLGSIGAGASLNRFAYANGQPVSQIDPLGLAMADLNPISTGGELTATEALKAINAGLGQGALDLPYNLTIGAVLALIDSGSTHLSGAVVAGQEGDYALAALNAVAFAGDAAQAVLAGLGIGRVVNAGVQAGAAMVAEGTATAENVAANEVKVIGRLSDAAVAKPWPGHDVLDIPDWTPAKNAQWMDNGVKNAQVFYTASPEAGNLVQSSGRFAGQPTIYAQEVQQLKVAGYVKVGDYYVPASRAATFKP